MGICTAPCTEQVPQHCFTRLSMNSNSAVISSAREGSDKNQLHSQIPDDFSTGCGYKKERERESKSCQEGNICCKQTRCTDVIGECWASSALQTLAEHPQPKKQQGRGIRGALRGALWMGTAVAPWGHAGDGGQCLSAGTNPPTSHSMGHYS